MFARKKMLSIFSFLIFFYFVGSCFGIQRPFMLGLDIFDTSNQLKDRQDREKRSTDCMGDCLLSMSTSMKTHFPNFSEEAKQSNIDPMGLTSLQKENFKKLCQDIKSFLGCTNPCPASNDKSLILSGFDGLKLICIDHYQEIYDNYECLQKSNIISDEQCVKGTCKSSSNVLTTFSSQQATFMQTQDFNRVKSLMSNYCQFINCFIECDKPITEKQCGKKIADIIDNDIVGSTLMSIKKSLAAVNQNVWPEQCETILKITGGNTASRINLFTTLYWLILFCAWMKLF